MGRMKDLAIELQETREGRFPDEAYTDDTEESPFFDDGDGALGLNYHEVSADFLASIGA